MTSGVFSAASTDNPSALPKIPVAIAPGEMLLTRMPASPSSIATHLVRCMTAALAAHMWCGVLHAEHHAAQQRRHRRIETIGLEAFDAAGLRRSAGIIKKAVDAAEAVHGFADQLVYVVFNGDVGATEDAGRPKLFGQGLALGETG